MRLLAEAQRRGEIIALPLVDVLLAANATMQGLAHMIIEGRLGAVDDARAVDLAVAVTRVLGTGLIPRGEELLDPQQAMPVPDKSPKR